MSLILCYVCYVTYSALFFEQNIVCYKKKAGNLRHHDNINAYNLECNRQAKKVCPFSGVP